MDVCIETKQIGTKYTERLFAYWEDNVIFFPKIFLFIKLRNTAGSLG